MTDALPAFEPVWADMEATKRALADTIAAMKSAGLIGPIDEQKPTPEQIHAAAERARRHFRRSRIADVLRGRPIQVIPECAHASVAEVESAGEVVAGLCLDCDAQLSPAWFTCMPHEQAGRVYVDSEVLTCPSFGESTRLALRDCPTCGTRWWGQVTIADWARWL